ncbi:MAG: hypothetical protein HY275_07115 [Gemmatimonadetes bacterium]|nr:hypothetical protein [Gemmatimonadota bacterium]
MTLSRFFTTTAFALLFAVPAAAQDASLAAPATDVVRASSPQAPIAATSFAPVAGSDVVGISTRAARTATLPAPAPMVGDKGNSVALMITGAAVMVAGALVNGSAGNVIMIGGGVVAIIGLWNYLQ